MKQSMQKQYSQPQYQLEYLHPDSQDIYFNSEDLQNRQMQEYGQANQYQRNSPQQQNMYQITPDIIDNSDLFRQQNINQRNVFDRLTADSGKRRLMGNQPNNQVKQRGATDTSYSPLNTSGKQNSNQAPKFSQKLNTKHALEVQKVEQLRKEKINQEISECKTVPTINPYSKAIIQGIRGENNPQNQLSQDQRNQVIKQNVVNRIQNRNQSMGSKDISKVRQYQQPQVQRYQSQSFDQNQRQINLPQSTRNLGQQIQNVKQDKRQHMGFDEMINNTQDPNQVLQILRAGKEQYQNSQSQHLIQTATFQNMRNQSEDDQVEMSSEGLYAHPYKENIINMNTQQQNQQNRQIYDHYQERSKSSSQMQKQNFNQVVNFASNNTQKSNLREAQNEWQGQKQTNSPAKSGQHIYVNLMANQSQKYQECEPQESYAQQNMQRNQQEQYQRKVNQQYQGQIQQNANIQQQRSQGNYSSYAQKAVNQSLQQDSKQNIKREIQTPKFLPPRQMTPNTTSSLQLAIDNKIKSQQSSQKEPQAYQMPRQYPIKNQATMQNQINVANRNNNWLELKRQKLDERKQMKDKEEVSECTFTPYFFTKAFARPGSNPESPNSSKLYSKAQSPNHSYLEQYSKKRSESPRSNYSAKQSVEERKDCFRNYFPHEQNKCQTTRPQSELQRMRSWQEIPQNAQKNIKQQQKPQQQKQTFIKPSDCFKSQPTSATKQQKPPSGSQQSNSQIRVGYTQLSPSRQRFGFANGFDMNRFLNKATPLVSYKDPLNSANNIYAK